MDSSLLNVIVSIEVVHFLAVRAHILTVILSTLLLQYPDHSERAKQQEHDNEYTLQEPRQSLPRGILSMLPYNISWLRRLRDDWLLPQDLHIQPLARDGQRPLVALLILESHEAAHGGIHALELSGLYRVKLLVDSTQVLPVVVLNVETALLQGTDQDAILVGELDVGNPDSVDVFFETHGGNILGKLSFELTFYVFLQSETVWIPATLVPLIMMVSESIQL